MKNSEVKTTTDWAVEVDGKISVSDIVKTRRLAREVRKDVIEYEAYAKGRTPKAHVRKVQIVPVEGR